MMPYLHKGIAMEKYKDTTLSSEERAKALKGYQKVKVPKGEIVPFEIILDKESFYFYDGAMQYDVHDSDYTISLASSSVSTIRSFEIAVRNKEIVEAS